MNVVTLLAQLFEEAGFVREKQVRLKRLSFTSPPPGTYRIDDWYNNVATKRAYLTTRDPKKHYEFFIDGTKITIYRSLYRAGFVDLEEPDSLELLMDIIKEPFNEDTI